MLAWYRGGDGHHSCITALFVSTEWFGPWSYTRNWCGTSRCCVGNSGGTDRHIIVQPVRFTAASDECCTGWHFVVRRIKIFVCQKAAKMADLTLLTCTWRMSFWKTVKYFSCGCRGGWLLMMLTLPIWMMLTLPILMMLTLPILMMLTLPIFLA